MTAAADDERVAAWAKLIEEMMGHGRFTCPWRSVEKHDAYRAALRGTKLTHQRLRLPSAIDDVVRPFARPLIGARAEAIDSQARQDLLVGRADGWIGIQQIAA